MTWGIRSKVVNFCEEGTFSNQNKTITKSKGLDGNHLIFLFSSTPMRKRLWPSLNLIWQRESISLPTSRSSSRISLPRAILFSQKFYLLVEYGPSIFTLKTFPRRSCLGGCGNTLRIDLVNGIDGWDWKKGEGDAYVHSTPIDLRRGVLRAFPSPIDYRMSLLGEDPRVEHANASFGSHVDSYIFLAKVISMTSNPSLLMPIPYSFVSPN